MILNVYYEESSFSLISWLRTTRSRTKISWKQVFKYLYIVHEGKSVINAIEKFARYQVAVSACSFVILIFIM